MKMKIQLTGILVLSMTRFLYCVDPCNTPLLPGTNNTTISTLGIQFLEAGTTTPQFEFGAQDTMGAIGPKQYVYNTNCGAKSYTIDRAAGTAVVDNVIWSGIGPFFTEVALTNTNALFGDPRIRYDKWSGRWYRINLGIGATNVQVNNSLYIAVSEQTEDLTPETQWTLFSIPHNLIPEGDGRNHRDNGVPIGATGDNGLFLDFPTLGIDAYNLYIGARPQAIPPIPSSAFPCAEGSTVIVVKKESLFNGGNVIIWAYRNLLSANANCSSASGIAIPQGVDNLDEPNPKYGYFIGENANTFYAKVASNILVMHRVINPESNAPILSDKIEFTVPLVYQDAGALPAVSPLGPSGIAVPYSNNMAGVFGGFDSADRLEMAHVAKDPATSDLHLFTTGSTLANSTGQFVSIATSDRRAVRWYEIKTKGNDAQEENLTIPTTVQSGTIWDPRTTTTPNFYYYPAIMTNKQGDITVTCNVSGVNRFIDVVSFRRNYNDAQCTIGPEQVIKASTQPYNGARTRGADYTYTSRDPVNESNMWNISEFFTDYGLPGYVITELKP